MPTAQVAIPFHLTITEPIQVDPESPTVNFNGSLLPGAYDEGRQMWLGEDGLPRDVRLSSNTTCEGISGTDIGGIIFSDQHTVTDKS